MSRMWKYDTSISSSWLHRIWPNYAGKCPSPYDLNYYDKNNSPSLALKKSIYLFTKDLVYKIVPDLEMDEFKRERKFYSERGLPCPKDQALEQESEEKRAAEAEAAMTPDANTNMDFHRFDEQVSSA